MKLAGAQEIAESVMRYLDPFCQRMEIAGSVRREKEEVHDIELCVVPKNPAVVDIFGLPTETINLLEMYPWSSLGEKIKNGPRYKQIALIEGINLDLFIVLPPADWGVIYTIRTGPAEFSHWCVTKRREGGGLPSDCKVTSGFVLRNNIYLPMAEEIDFLNFLGLGWIEPKDWQPGWRKA